MTANPDTIAIVSGGQGEGELISEAACMHDWLVEKGIMTADQAASYEPPRRRPQSSMDPKGGEGDLLADYVPDSAPYTLDDDGGRDLLLITYGRTYGEVAALCRRYREEGKSVSVLKLNRILPIEAEVVALAAQYQCVLVLEETRGGVGDLLGSRLMQAGFGGHYAVRAIEETLGACTTAQGLHRVGLDAAGIDAFVKAHTEGVYGV
jgi:deoxyxylulose-5-phosphate synthase